LFIFKAFLTHVTTLRDQWSADPQCRGRAPKITPMIVIVDFTTHFILLPFRLYFVALIKHRLERTKHILHSELLQHEFTDFFTTYLLLTMRTMYSISFTSMIESVKAFTKSVLRGFIVVIPDAIACLECLKSMTLDSFLLLPLMKKMRMGTDGGPVSCVSIVAKHAYPIL